MYGRLFSLQLLDITYTSFCVLTCVYAAILVTSCTCSSLWYSVYFVYGGVVSPDLFSSHHFGREGIRYCGSVFGRTATVFSDPVSEMLCVCVCVCGWVCGCVWVCACVCRCVCVRV